MMCMRLKFAPLYGVSIAFGPAGDTSRILASIKVRVYSSSLTKVLKWFATALIESRLRCEKRGPRSSEIFRRSFTRIAAPQQRRSGYPPPNRCSRRCHKDMRASNFTFAQLEVLRRSIDELRTTHIESLNRYYDEPSNGFARRSENLKLSLASTATCLTSLIATGEWTASRCKEWKQRDAVLATNLLAAEIQSAKLKATAFTIAFVVEAITMLCEHGVKLNNAQEAVLKSLEKRLIRSLNGKHRGAVAIDEYPPTAYVTQLVVRVLERRKLLDRNSKLRTTVRAWSV